MSPPDLSRLHALSASLRLTGQAMAAQRERFQRLAKRSENGIAKPAIVADQLFQTPAALAERLVSLLGNIRGLSVLEPSAGLGRLADELHRAGAGEIQAVEVNGQCSEMLRSRSWLKVKTADFLETSPAGLGLFDVVAMNPPFRRGTDIKHIRHALQFLMPQGVLAGLCYGGEKQKAALQPLSSHWEEIGRGAFRESGTETSTFLFTIYKAGLTA